MTSVQKTRMNFSVLYFANKHLSKYTYYLDHSMVCKFFLFLDEKLFETFLLNNPSSTLRIFSISLHLKQTVRTDVMKESWDLNSTKPALCCNRLKPRILWVLLTNNLQFNLEKMLFNHGLKEWIMFKNSNGINKTRSISRPIDDDRNGLFSFFLINCDSPRINGSQWKVSIGRLVFSLSLVSDSLRTSKWNW